MPTAVADSNLVAAMQCGRFTSPRCPFVCWEPLSFANKKTVQVKELRDREEPVKEWFGNRDETGFGCLLQKDGPGYPDLCR